MNDIPLKVLVVDSDEHAARVLAEVLREEDAVLNVEIRNTVPDAATALATCDINVVYIDPLGLGTDGTSGFIFKTRRKYPAVVFVLYFDFDLLKSQENTFFAGERRRFRHYFTLEKTAPGPDFVYKVRDTLTACQGDLAFNLTQEKIADLQRELEGIQESTEDDSAVVPLRILQEIHEQLTALKKERQSPGALHAAARFLGPTAPSVKADRCFVIMPYSQDWSEAVEDILRETCKVAGFEFSIAKEMDGRFIPHDIWQGITGSAIMIADLTGANANVAYEIGLADAIGREIVLICQDTKVPFDFLAQRLIVYQNSVKGALDLRRKLSEKLQSIKRSTEGS